MVARSSWQQLNFCIDFSNPKFSQNQSKPATPPNAVDTMFGNYQ